MYAFESESTFHSWLIVKELQLELGAKPEV